MSPCSDTVASAFRQLQSRLARRRLAQLDPRLRLELLVLAVLLSSFVFWQIRTPFAGVRHQGGALAVLGALALAWAVLALLAGGLVAARHAHRLRTGPPGPAWLALPVPPPLLARHLAWESAALAAWMVVPAAGIWAAALGLVPVWWLLALAPLLSWTLLEAVRGGAALGARLSSWGLREHPELHPLQRALAAALPASRRRSVRPARWSRQPVWLALCAKDLRLTLRVPSLGRQLAVALLFWTLSLCAWHVPDLTPGRQLDYAAAFVLGLIGSAALGEWLVALSGADPFATVRTLPVGLSAVWGGRYAWAVLATALLLAGHGITARELAPQALRVFLVWLGGATLAIAALAVNYGVTLFPRADLAQRLLGLSLGLAVAASLMIPLMGWLVLVSAILHSARRLPRWARLEET